MSFEIDEFLNPSLGILPDRSFTNEMINSMKRNTEQTKVICGSIYYNLKSSNSERRLKTVYFLEILAKNSDPIFHVNLFTPHFCKVLLRILAKRRKKRFQFFNYLISSNKSRQNEIENRLLFLIQVWYDTFMLYNKEFFNILNVYKTLRKEGVIFPLRDPKNKDFIKFNGEKSPIFDNLDNNGFMYEEPNKLLCQKSYTVEEIESKNFSLFNSCTEFIRNTSNSKDPYRDDFFLKRKEFFERRKKEENLEQNANQNLNPQELKKLLQDIEELTHAEKEFCKLEGKLKREGNQ
jgi:hypothetical protein